MLRRLGSQKSSLLLLTIVNKVMDMLVLSGTHTVETFERVFGTGIGVPADEFLHDDLGVFEVGRLVVVGLSVHSLKGLLQILGPPHELLEV